MKLHFAAPALACSCLSLLPLAAHAADEGVFRGRAGVAAVSYVFSTNALSSPDQKSDFAALALGGSYVTASGWFFDLATRISLGAKWNAKEYNAAQGEVTGDADFSRNELTLTVGKSLGSGWTAFGGIQASSLEQVFPQNSLGAESTWEQDGTLAFIGGSKAFSVGSGVLNISGAVGTLKYDFPDWASQPDRGNGGSLGLTYSHPLSTQFSAVADLRYQSYSLKWQGFDFKEKISSIGVSLVGQF